MSSFTKNDENKPEFDLVPKEFTKSIFEVFTTKDQVFEGLILLSEKEMCPPLFSQLFLSHLLSETKHTIFSYQKSVAEVFTYGKNKYEEDNWKKCTDRKRYINSLSRHLVNYFDVNERDEESDLLEIGHIGANIAFLCYLDSNDE